MGTLYSMNKGFTIIEVMLFLAVSGALAVGILGSSTMALNNQRYIDSVNSFKSLIQGEVISTTRVVNARSGNVQCPQLDTVSSPVGTNDCVIMGRLITVKQGKDITLSSLIGLQGTGPVAAGDDIAMIRSYLPLIDASSQQERKLSWDTQLKNGESLNILIIRSPESGNILIFTQRRISADFDTTNPNALTDFVISSDFRNTIKQEICIDPSGWSVAQAQGIIINPRASGPSGIEQLAGAGC